MDTLKMVATTPVYWIDLTPLVFLALVIRACWRWLRGKDEPTLDFPIQWQSGPDSPGWAVVGSMLLAAPLAIVLGGGLVLLCGSFVVAIVQAVIS